MASWRLSLTPSSTIEPVQVNYDIHLACRNGDVGLLEKWINSEKCDVNVKDKAGWTPLHYAVSYGNHTVALLLLTHPDICVLCVNKDLSTPLHYAVRSKDMLSDSLRKVLEGLAERGTFNIDDIELNDC